VEEFAEGPPPPEEAGGGKIRGEGRGRAKRIWLTDEGSEAAGRGLETVAIDEAYSLAAELRAARSGGWRYLLRVMGQSMAGW
jgi:hypothetical protein